MSTSPFVGSATSAGPLGRQVEGARLEEPGGLVAAGGVVPGADEGGDETEGGTGAAFSVLETGVVRCECLSKSDRDGSGPTRAPDDVVVPHLAVAARVGLTETDLKLHVAIASKLCRTLWIENFHELSRIVQTRSPSVVLQSSSPPVCIGCRGLPDRGRYQNTVAFGFNDFPPEAGQLSRRSSCPGVRT
jgi:hypothetical protein